LKNPLDGSPVIGSGSGLTIHWSGPRGQGASFLPGALPIRDCLVEVLHCQPPDFAFAVIESLLANRALRSEDVEWLTGAVPSRRRLLGKVRSDAGSGTESLFRYRMSRLGVDMQSQVEIDGVGRVDFVIGDRILVEIESQEHHGGRAQRIRDLDRDAVAHALGYLPLRFDYVQIFSDWEAVASTVLAITDRGDHLSQSRTSV
jgi:very-short-patch-repair endonuclease